MTSGELLDLFRVEMNDAEAPYLWTNAFVTDAINEAQVEFARKTDGIPDATTPEVTEIEIVAGTDTYQLHEKVLKIRAARRADNGRPIEVVNVEDMASRNMYFDGLPGELKALVIGMDEYGVQAWPMPASSLVAKLTVFRMPLADIVGDQEFEIAARHHRYLLHWVKHLAYSVQDAETFDKTKAADFEDKFNAYCFSVKLEQERLRHKPRAVVYGGI